MAYRRPASQNLYFPNSLVLWHPPLRIGVLHGHQIVPPGDVDSQCSLARAMDVDVLITGHTHRFDAFEREGRFFVNPGSATGAWSSVWPIAEDGDGQLSGDGNATSVEEKAAEDNAADATATSPKADGDSQVKQRGATSADRSAAAKPDGLQRDESRKNGSAEAIDASAEEGTRSGSGPVSPSEGATADKKPDATRIPKAAPEPTPSFARECLCHGSERCLLCVC